MVKRFKQKSGKTLPDIVYRIDQACSAQTGIINKIYIKNLARYGIAENKKYHHISYCKKGLSENINAFQVKKTSIKYSCIRPLLSF